jgi:outer membrane protein OmpA-like peptidoglycan-associated protein
MNNLSMNTRPARPLRGALAGAVLAAMLLGCGTTPEPNSALTQAHASYRALQSDPQVNRLASAELTQAREALSRADTAWTRHETLRTVDHLAYLAQQRIAIARETSNARMSELRAASAGADFDNPRRVLAVARQDTHKTTELAVAMVQRNKARAADLEMQLKELNAKQTERGAVITLDDVQFDSNRAELPPGGLRDMDKLVDFFERHPTRTALIEGFTDSQGSKSANLELSLRRAGAVRHALIDQGVFAGRLETRGYGDAYPASTNGTVAGRQMNRRVEIVLSGDDGTVKAR